MSSNSADVAQNPRDTGLVGMIVLSAGIHAAAVGLALVLPYTLRDSSPQLVSYTVDLVAPDRLGGTNIPGPRPKPPQPKAQAAPPPPAVAAEPQPPAPKPEPKREAKPPEPVAKPKQEPKAEKKPEAAPVKVAAKKEPAPKPAAKTEPKKEAAKPVDEKKAAEAKPEAKKEAKPEEKKEAKPEEKKEATKPELSPEAAREEIATRLREERLAAAVKRAQERVEQSAAVGTGAGDGSSPASIGPGEGSGGILKGLEWLMYKNNVETTIRENWVWSGADHALETIIRFGITEAGEVVDVRIEKSSGDPSYDASVERAVRMVNPLPPPPEAYRDDFREYELTFNAEFLQM